MASPMPSPHAIGGPHLMHQSSSPRGISQQQHSLDQMESPFSPAGAMASPQPVANAQSEFHSSINVVSYCYYY